MIKVTNNIEEAEFVTHSGNFHADDVFGTIFMEKLYGNITVARVSNYIDDGTKMAFDIGRGKFDHHQKGYDEKRENGIHYCGFGLLWREFGLGYLKKLALPNPELTYEIFDYLLVNMIDAIDNGEFDIKSDYNVYTLSALIELFRPRENDTKDENECFIEATNFARIVFDLVLKDSIEKTEAVRIIKDKVPEIKDKILVLDKSLPFDFAIHKLNLDVEFVVYPSNRGGYAAHTVSKYYKGFEPRKKFREEWAGLVDEELIKVSGIKGARFCHNARFLFIADTKEAAIKAAELSVKSK